MGPPPATRPTQTAPRPPPGDDGFAILTVVTAAAVLMALIALLLMAILPGTKSSARQRELNEARAVGFGAIEYLYAQLDDDPDFFADMLDETSPTTYPWIDLSSAAAPDVTVDGDWNQFGDDLAISACATRGDPCWELRFKGDRSRDPEGVAVEAIVRFDCRSGLYCSTRRFQQQLRRLEADPPHDHEWVRTGLAEVTEPLAPVSITTTTTVAPGTPVAPLDLQITGYTELDDGGYQVCFDWDLPDSGPPGSLHLLQWKSGTEEYQDSGPTTFLWFDVAVCLETFQPGTYTFRVRSQNADGLGSPSNEVTVTLSP